VTDDDCGHPRKWIILATVAFGMFMSLLDATVVNIAIPAMMTDLGTDLAELSWVLNAYGIAIAVLFLSFGRLADRYGERLVFAIGLALFTGFSFLCGLAPSTGWLIGFRVGQAVGAAAMVPVSLVIMLGAFPRRQHGLATGLWGSLGSIAAVVGPPIGGVLVHAAGWNWIFFINAPVGVLALTATFLFVPEHRRDPHGAGIDGGGILLSGGAILTLTLALTQGNAWGWGSARVVGLLVASIVLLVLFVVYEERAERPMLDLALFRIRPFWAANAAGLGGAIGMGGAMLLVIIFLVSIKGMTELEAAIATTPIALSALIFTPLFGRAVDRVGPRLPASVGALVFAVAFVLLAQIRIDTSVASMAWRFAVLGLALGLSMPAMTAAGMSRLPRRSEGVGSAMLGTTRQIGFVLGVAILVAVTTYSTGLALDAARTEARAYVSSLQTLPAGEREAMIARIDANIAAARARVGGGVQAGDLIAGVADPAAAAPGERERTPIRADLTAIFTQELGDAFALPLYAAALFALASLPFCLLLGRTLQHPVYLEAGDTQAAVEGTT